MSVITGLACRIAGKDIYDSLVEKHLIVPALGEQCLDLRAADPESYAKYFALWNRMGVQTLVTNEGGKPEWVRRDLNAEELARLQYFPVYHREETAELHAFVNYEHGELDVLRGFLSKAMPGEKIQFVQLTEGRKDCEGIICDGEFTPAQYPM